MRRLPLPVALVALFACSEPVSDFNLGPTDANVVGTFTLVYSNGRPLPILARHAEDEQWDMASDKMVIAADNTWRETSN